MAGLEVCPGCILVRNPDGTFPVCISGGATKVWLEQALIQLAKTLDTKYDSR